MPLGAPNAAASAAASSDFPVGTEVQLAAGYEAHEGILTPGDKGVVVESDGTDVPYKVRSRFPITLLS